MLYKKPPNISHIRVFGCLFYAANLANKDKFKPKAATCVLLGFSSTQKGYILYNLEENKVLVVS